MRNDYTENFISAVKAFSGAADDFLLWAERNGAGQHPDRLASEWDGRLSRFFTGTEDGGDGIGGQFLLTRENMDIFTQNITVSEDRPTARRFNLIPIEPMRYLGMLCSFAGLKDRSDLVMAVHDFALGLRRYGSRHPF